MTDEMRRHRTRARPSVWAVRGAFRLVLALSALVVAHVLFADLLMLLARRNARWRKQLLPPYNAVILYHRGSPLLALRRPQTRGPSLGPPIPDAVRRFYE